MRLICTSATFFSSSSFFVFAPRPPLPVGVRRVLIASAPAFRTKIHTSLQPSHTAPLHSTLPILSRIVSRTAQERVLHQSPAYAYSHALERHHTPSGEGLNTVFFTSRDFSLILFFCVLLRVNSFSPCLRSFSSNCLCVCVSVSLFLFSFHRSLIGAEDP